MRKLSLALLFTASALFAQEGTKAYVFYEYESDEASEAELRAACHELILNATTQLSHDGAPLIPEPLQSQLKEINQYNNEGWNLAAGMLQQFGNEVYRRICDNNYGYVPYADHVILPNEMHWFKYDPVEKKEVSVKTTIDQEPRLPQHAEIAYHFRQGLHWGILQLYRAQYLKRPKPDRYDECGHFLHPVVIAMIDKLCDAHSD